MNIVYVSSLIPPQMLDEVLAPKGGNYLVAPNKFHHTIVDELISNGHYAKYNFKEQKKVA